MSSLAQLVHQDSEAFLRYGIAQSTAGSVSEELAERMVERFPKELLVTGWEGITAENDRFGDVLRGLDLPLLIAKHEGCLMSTDEGFEEFGVAVPEFCEEVSDRLATGPGERPAPAGQPPLP